MATRLGTAYVPVDGDWTAFNRKLKTQGRTLDRRFHGMGLHLGGLLSTGAAVGAAGLAAAVLEGKRSVAAFRESNQVAKQTQAVLKSTGRQAHVTARDMGDLATAISRKSGLDDEAVQSAENVLATFTKVRNETGKGNQVFDRATRTIADMSVALGTDLKSSTIQVGKALNDPVKGITALQRVGVSFTEQQRDQIKTLVDSGQQLKAQKIILRELGTEFGGSAKAQATSAAKLKVELGNLEEGIGRGLAPAVDVVNDKLTHLARDVQPDLQRVSDRVAKIFNRDDLDLAGKLRLSGHEVRDGFAPLITEAHHAIDQLHIGDRLGNLIDKAAPKIADAAGAAAPRAAGAFVHAFMDAGPWGRLVATGFVLSKMGGLGAFTRAGRLGGAAMGEGIATSPGWKGKAAQLGKGLGVAAAIAFIPEIAKTIKHPETSFKVEGTSKLELPRYTPLPVVRDIPVLKDLDHWFDKVLSKDDDLKEFGSTAEKSFKRLQKAGDVKGLRQLADQAERLADDYPKYARGLREFGTASEDMAEQVAQSIGAPWLKSIRRSWNRFEHSGASSLKSIRNTTEINMEVIRDRIGVDTDAGREAMAKNFRLAAHAVKVQMEAGTIDTKKGSRLIRKYLVQGLTSMGLSHGQATAKLENGTLQPSSSRTPGQAGDRGRQRGGHINEGAPSGDSVPAMLERGEYVLNREAVKRLGTRALDKINFKHAPRFQSGGMVRVPGDPDTTGGRDLVNRAIVNKVAAWIKKFHAQIGYAYDPGHHESAGHNVTGTATDVVPGPGGSWDMLEAGLRAFIRANPGNQVLYGTNGVGTPYPNHGRGNHAHIEWGGAHAVGGPGFAAITAPKIKAVVSALAGGPGALANRALTVERDTAQSVADRVARSLSASTGPGGPHAMPGGSFGKAALKKLWVQAKGDPKVANLMAAIALAESTGNPNAHNASGASGLWQILGQPFPGNVFDPLTNARMAVSKYKSQGLGAWEVYTSGAYRQYLQRGGVARMQGGGSVPAGPGRLDHLFPRHTAADVQGRARLSADQVRGLARRAGLPAAQFEQIARGESSFYPGIVSSDQGYGLWQMTPRVWGAAAKNKLAQLGGVGQMLNPWRNALMARYLYAASGNSFAPWHGTRYLADTGKGPALGKVHGAVGPHKGKPRGRGRGKHRGLPAAIAHGQLNDPRGILRRIRSLGLGDALAGRLKSQRGAVALDIEGVARAASLSTTPDTTGYEDMSLAQLQTLARERGIDPAGMNKPTLLARLEEDIPGVYQGKNEITWLIQQLGDQLKLRNSIIYARGVALAKRDETDKLTTTARTRLATVSAAVDQGTREEHNLETALTAAQKHPNKNKTLIKSLRGQLRAVRERVAGRTRLRDTIKDKILPALTGKSTRLKDLSGNSGLLGELVDLQGLGSPMTYMATLPDLGVLGGAIGEAQLNLAALTKAKPAVADDSSTSGADSDGRDAARADLAEQLAEVYRRRAVASERQFDIFKAFPMPPYAGKFHQGGIIPGPAGAERMALVQAGERVTPAAAADAPVVVVQVADGMAWLEQFVDVRVVRGTRDQARAAGRGLPSRGGGLLKVGG